MEDIREFRNALAEQGIEMTPMQTKEVLTGIERLKKVIRRTVADDPEYYERWEAMDADDRRGMVRYLADNGIETTPDEFDAISDILLRIYRQEYPDGPPYLDEED
jgi:hypothetical protein